MQSSFDEFYSLPRNSIEFLTLGSSHIAYGFSPLMLYKETGITSYNLGTFGQAVDVSYFLLKEALKYQKPKNVFLDVSKLSSNEEKEISRTFISDILPITNKNRIDIILESGEEKEFINLTKEKVFSCFFLIYAYHNRFSTLPAKNIITKTFTNGEQIFSTISPYSPWKSKVPVNIDRFGNTSSASIPLLLCSEFWGRESQIGTSCM